MSDFFRFFENERRSGYVELETISKKSIVEEIAQTKNQIGWLDSADLWESMENKTI